MYSFDPSGKRCSDTRQESHGDLWANTWRYLWTYDTHGNMVTEVFETWRKREWVRVGCASNTYDASGNWLSCFQQWWHGENEQAVFSELFMYTYDGTGNQLSYTYEHTGWGDGQWLNEYHFTCSYDASGNKLSELFEQWSEDHYENRWRATYTYNTNSTRATWLSEVYSQGQWTNRERETYTYDARGHRLTTLSDGWSYDRTMYSRRITYSYDANGNNLDELVEYWWGGRWEPRYHTMYTYDVNGNRLTRSSDDWRTTWTYDANGQTLTEAWEQQVNGEWGDLQHFTFTYDVNGNVIAMAWDVGFGVGDPPSDFPGCGVKIVDGAGNDYNTDGYIVSASLSWRSAGTEGVPHNGNIPPAYTLSQNYPNPFNPATTIPFSVSSGTRTTLAVYDILGREVARPVDEWKDPGEYRVQFDASGLASGMYICRFTAGPVSRTTKMVLMR